MAAVIAAGLENIDYAAKLETQAKLKNATQS